ncbi:MAG: hypothetical protein ACXWWQ_03540, partial [Candidatus Limnocylindria bacterium]
EQARVVSDAEAGIVTDDPPEAIADAIGELMTAAPEQRAMWAAHAHAAARAASWAQRAAVIVDRLAGLRA